MTTVHVVLLTVGVVLSAVGLGWGLARWLDGKLVGQSDRLDKVEARMNVRVDECHSRINETRQMAASRADLESAVDGVKEAIREMRQDFRDIHDRIDKLLTKLVDKGG